MISVVCFGGKAPTGRVQNTFFVFTQVGWIDWFGRFLSWRNGGFEFVGASEERGYGDRQALARTCLSEKRDRSVWSRFFVTIESLPAQLQKANIKRSQLTAQRTFRISHHIQYRNQHCGDCCHHVFLLWWWRWLLHTGQVDQERWLSFFLFGLRWKRELSRFSNRHLNLFRLLHTVPDRALAA